MDMNRCFGYQALWHPQKMSVSKYFCFCSYEIDQIREWVGGGFNQGFREALQALWPHTHSTTNIILTEQVQPTTITKKV